MALRSVVRVLRWVEAPHWAAVALMLWVGVGGAAAQSSGGVRGHVTSASGLPLAGGAVRLTLDRTADAGQRAYSFSFPLDGNGDYGGAGVVPSVYMAVAFSADGKLMDSVDNVRVEAGKTVTVDFDMTRQAYIDAMPAAERKALEEFKQQNKATIEAYQHIRQADALLIQARERKKAGQYDEAVTLMQTAIQLVGDQPLLWYTLGDAQLGVANGSAAAKKGRKISSMPDVAKQYDDALGSYRKALDLNLARTRPSAELTGAAWNQVGEILGKLGKTKDAIDSEKKAIAAYPAETGFYALNEAVIAYDAGDMEDAAEAAGQAIKADPTAVEAYYLKGKATDQRLNAVFGENAATDTVGMKLDIFAAYEAYIALAPKGGHADEVRVYLSEHGYVQNAVKGLAVAKNSAGGAAALTSQAGAGDPNGTVSQSTTVAQVAAAAPAMMASAAVPATPTAGVNRGVTVVDERPPTRPGLPIPHNYALIFATDTYAHWERLQNPVSDADALNDALTTLYGFQVEEQKNLTGEQILEKLTEYLHRHFNPQDQLMIVFSGHGYFDEDLEKGYLTPADALPVAEDLGHRTLVAHETIMSYVNRIPSRHVVLVVDACFAGTLDRRIADSGLRGDVADVYVHATLPELLQRKENKRTRVYFASGGKDFVPDGQPGHHSPFMSALLVTLNRAADQKGYATLDDLQEGLNTVNPEPRWGDIQGDNDPGADFLLLTPAAVRLLTAAN